MGGFLGMRGTGSWDDSNIRPKDWRQTLLYMEPNGDYPLTAIMSMMSSERATDPQFYWWTKTLPTQSGAITNIYTDFAMSSAYTTGGTTGDTLYVKVAEATADMMRKGHAVLLRDASHYDVDVVALITEVDKNGASSRLTVRLLEDDDNGASTDLSDADTILVVGNANPEGGVMPDAISYEPTKYYNYTQIFRTPVEMTRTQIQTKLRAMEAWKEAKKEALKLHGVEMERGFLFGVRAEITGENGHPQRFTQGLVPFIKGATASGSTVDDYSLNTDYAGDAWTTSGEDWLDEQLADVFKYGSSERLALCGTGAINAINRLAKAGGTINLQPTSPAYGLRVLEWIHPQGTIYLKRHPLFTYEDTNNYTMVLFEPKNLKERYIQQTKYYDDKSSGSGRIDGLKEEWLTEVGLEFHYPQTCAYLNGVGVDNGLTP